MTKQERNDVILQALQTELQDKAYAKDKLEETFELWVQGLVAQGNQLLGQSGQAPMQGAAGGAGASEPAPEEGTAPEEPAPDTNEGGE